MLNKVPEVTIWFWIIKILCTTVGESFADWINMTLGVGLVNTSLLFTAVFVVVLAVQMKVRAYVPFAYWLTVVVVSVTGTLYTDILTDQQGVPLAVSSSIFALLLAVVFAVWYARERTLSIHSIDTTPREGFYWLAVLVTFALGTATGDWTLDLTGWGPGKSVLLPLALIAIVTGLWRYGADAILTFWIAYILTRPLGANIGDWLATPGSEKGLGLGTLTTSIIFLSAILGTVIYLTISRADVIEDEEPSESAGPVSTPARRKVSLAVLGVAAAGTAGLLVYANSQPHTTGLADDAPAPTCSQKALTQAQATQHIKASFPAASVTRFRTIVQDTLAKVTTGDQAGAKTRIKDLETAWDDGQATLQPKDCSAWTFLDGQIDDALTSVRAATPKPADEKATLQAFLTTLG
ncbi:MAG: hypothetical protein JWO22_1662 [Frankiales bacterium]|nr:hypothetical protein [Frankiales bacterium]